MILPVVSVPVFADDSDSVYFDVYGNSITEHDVVMTDENGNEYLRTIYCLQKDYVWPKEWTEYKKGLGHDSFLTTEQLNTITKLMYAGYPYNTVGLLNPIYDAYEDLWGKETADYIAVSVTQDAIWTLLERWGIEGNTPEQRDWVGEEYQAYSALLDFANNGTLPGAISSDTVAIQGDNVFKLGANNIWSTGDLKIVDPNGYQLSYSFTLPDGITAVDEDGNPLTNINGGTNFRLVTDDTNKIVSGSKLEITTTVKIPSEVSYYETNDASPISLDGKTKPFQTMLSIGINTKGLSGELGFAKPELGSLTVSKRIVNGPDDAEFWFEADIDIKDGDSEVTGWFPFVKTHVDGSTSNGTIYHFADTKMKFSLKARESITINDLPKGVNYTVTEYGLEENGNSLDNWTPSYENKTGVIGSSTNVSVTNSYAYSPVTVSVAVGTKTLLDLDNSSVKPDIAAGDYSFMLFPDTHGQPMPEGSVYNQNTNRYEYIVQNSASDPTTKVAPFNFGSVTFDKPGTYSYTVQELQVTKSNVSRDMRHWHAVVTVTASGGSLSAEVAHEHHHDDSHVPTPGCTHAPLSFENNFSRHSIDKEIGVNKTIINNSSDFTFDRSGYKFEIVPAGSSDNYPDLDLSTEGVQTSTFITTGKSGEAFTSTIKFTEGWFNSFDTDSDGVAVLVYNIKEIPKNSAGWIYDDRTATATIKITKNIIEDKTDTTPEVADYEAIIFYNFPGETSTTSLPNFINRYTATGTFKLAVKKVFSTENYVPEDGETYQFTINDEFERNDKSGYTLPTDNRVIITFDGTNNFETNQSFNGTNVIKFTKSGNYRFELSEVDEGKSFMTYDDKNWIVDVEVNDNGSGVLETHAVYYHEQSASTPLEEATFTNTYEPVVSTSLNLKKTLLGRDWNERDEFSIDIRHAELGTHEEATYDPCYPGNLESSHVNLEHDYEMVFTANRQQLTLTNINFKKEGVYFVYLKENKAFSSNDMVYDPVVYVIRYEIERNGNILNLKSTDIYDATNGWTSRTKLPETTTVLEFTNKVTNLSIHKENNEGSKSNRYEFTLELKNKEGVAIGNAEIGAKLAGNDTVLKFDANGKTKFYLRRGEEIQIIGLPEGSTVNVNETSTISSDTSYSVALDGVSDGEISGKKASVTPLQAGIVYEITFTNIDKNTNPTPYIVPNTGVN